MKCLPDGSFPTPEGDTDVMAVASVADPVDFALQVFDFRYAAAPEEFRRQLVMGEFAGAGIKP